MKALNSHYQYRVFIVAKIIIINIDAFQEDLAAWKFGCQIVLTLRDPRENGVPKIAPRIVYSLVSFSDSSSDNKVNQDDGRASAFLKHHLPKKFDVMWPMMRLAKN